jgi:hypothetical protein
MKQAKERNKEEEIVRELLRIVPGLPYVLRRTVRRIENFDFKQPTTIVEKIKTDFDGLSMAVEGGGDELVTKLYQWVSEAALQGEVRREFEETAKILKREAATDSRYSQLLRLMAEADARIPFVSVIVPLRHADPIERLSAQCAPVDLIHQAERAHGEERATAALRALSETMEVLYRHYLITVWQLSFLRNGELPHAQVPATGNLVKEAYSRLPDYPGLIEPDAGWMRNSAVHNPRVYVRANDSIVMWDKNVPRTEVRVDDLLAIVQRMYSISAVTIQRVGQLYMLRNMLLDTGMLDVLLESLPDLMSGDAAHQGEAEQRVWTKARVIIEPLQSFFGVQNQAA